MQACGVSCVHRLDPNFFLCALAFCGGCCHHRQSTRRSTAVCRVGEDRPAPFPLEGSAKADHIWHWPLATCNLAVGVHVSVGAHLCRWSTVTGGFCRTCLPRWILTCFFADDHGGTLPNSNKMKIGEWSVANLCCSQKFSAGIGQDSERVAGHAFR